MRQCARGWPARSERRSRGGQGHREEHKYHCGGGGMRPCACSSVGQHTCGSIRVRTCRSPVRRGCRLVHGQGGRLTHSMRSIRVATTRPAGRVWTAICGWLCVDGCVWIAMCGWCGWPRADDRVCMTGLAWPSSCRLPRTRRSATWDPCWNGRQLIPPAAFTSLPIRRCCALLPSLL